MGPQSLAVVTDNKDYRRRRSLRLKTYRESQPSDDVTILMILEPITAVIASASDLSAVAQRAKAGSNPCATSWIASSLTLLAMTAAGDAILPHERPIKKSAEGTSSGSLLSRGKHRYAFMFAFTASAEIGTSLHRWPSRYWRFLSRGNAIWNSAKKTSS
jgi:hypothetical protein